jgi:glycosyltransferase involved in cell wall biosynthesis
MVAKAHHTTIPTLTLGVAIYQSEKYLSELFDSLLRQTVLPGRILFLDDCSGDASASRIAAFAVQNPSLNVELFRNECNLGVAGTYNRIIALTTTEWLQILDGDDYFNNDFFKAVAPVLQKKYVAVATRFSCNIPVLSLMSGLLSLFVKKNVPQWMPLLGTVATRSGIIYNVSVLRHCPFADPWFDGSDIVNLMDVRKKGHTVFLRLPRMYYRIHRVSMTAGASSKKYEALLKSCTDIPLTYRIEFGLRKKIVPVFRMFLEPERKSQPTTVPPLTESKGAP